MKKTPLTLRRCPPQVHAALKESAKANRRSLNSEALFWLERQATEKPVTGKEAAAILRSFKKMLSRDDHRQVVRGIEEAHRRMAHEHLS